MSNRVRTEYGLRVPSSGNPTGYRVSPTFSSEKDAVQARERYLRNAGWNPDDIVVVKRTVTETPWRKVKAVTP